MATMLSVNAVMCRRYEMFKISLPSRDAPERFPIQSDAETLPFIAPHPFLFRRSCPIFLPFCGAARRAHSIFPGEALGVGFSSLHYLQLSRRERLNVNHIESLNNL